MAKRSSEPSLFPDEIDKKAQGPIECLGVTFENDEKRRAYFLEKLREKLQDPEFRKIEGFPIGDDEDILRISDPPYYTACPNPFINDYVKYYGNSYVEERDDYHREPFSSDISGSKSTPIYMAHTYNTKVPPESIAPLIDHYTSPGDIVLDPFCGSGMAGVAAHYVNASHRKQTPRRVILTDLSPFAAFLSHQMVHSRGPKRFHNELGRLLKELRSELDWLYRVSDGREINYAIWSDVWICPYCGNLENDWDLTVDEESLKTKPGVCSACGAELKRRQLERKKITFVDPFLATLRSQSEQMIARLVIRKGRSTEIFKPEEADLQAIHRAKAELPNAKIPVLDLVEGVNTQQPIHSHGFTHVHDFYTPRNLLFIAKYLEKAQISSRYHDLLFALTSVLVKTASRLHVIGFGGNINLAGQAPNTLQIPSSGAERNLFTLIENKASSLDVVFSYTKIPENVLVSTNAAQNMAFIEDDSIDYIFTDPPFGSNINYSEVNSLYEAWLGVGTSVKKEAIINKHQQKDTMEYEHLMAEALRECYRILKPRRWITVEFHNSHNAIWNAIQTAIGEAGFVLADVRVFDKGQGTWKQMTAAGTVKKDLLISAYKPDQRLEARFGLEAGTEEGVWDFARMHLKQLPVFVAKDGQTEVSAERQTFLLFDRMVAFHVQRGVAVPLSAADFYQGLTQRFPERDGMYFLPNQVAEYDKKRMSTEEVLQLELFVTDEASAIQWLRQQLTKKPQTFQELHPQFLREIGGWQKHEKPLELSDLLEQNFIRYDGNGEVPGQIHSYLSTNFRGLRNLSKDAPALRLKAKDRWYVPDPNKTGDLEKVRERALLREFWEYLPPGYEPEQSMSGEAFLPGVEPKADPIPRGKKIRVFRMEAVRAGFKHCWQNRDYRTIIAVAQRISENVLQEDPKLLMWYDQALTRTEG